MRDPNPVELQLLHHRMTSVAVAKLATGLVCKWGDHIPQILITFDERPTIDGLSTVFTNAALDAGLIHGRALLEFLGLKLDKHLRLTTRSAPVKGDDLAVEQFGCLTAVSVERALANANGVDAATAEAALQRLIFLAHKGIAHTTSSELGDADNLSSLHLAFKGVLHLMVDFFYRPLGIEPPEFEPDTRIVLRQPPQN